MTEDHVRGPAGKKTGAKLILLAPQYRLRGVRTGAGVAARTGANRGPKSLSLDERVRALAAEINRRWPSR
jgi:hypothetical protein